MTSCREDLEVRRFCVFPHTHGRGRLTACYHQSQKAGERLVLEWENISYTVKGKKILEDIHGNVASGEMLASTLCISIWLPTLCAERAAMASHGPVWGGQVDYFGRDIQEDCGDDRISKSSLRFDMCIAWLILDFRLR